MNMDKMISHKRLREVLNYEPETGIFRWKERISIRITVGKVAGSITNNGYVEIRVFGYRTTIHRLAWFYMTGNWPDKDIDHINGVRTDNRWDNLRAVTRSINLQNRRTAASHSTTGFLGVTRHQGRYRSMIRFNGKTRHIGCYDTPEQAYAAYVDAKRQHHPGNML